MGVPTPRDSDVAAQATAGESVHAASPLIRNGVAAFLCGILHAVNNLWIHRSRSIASQSNALARPGDRLRRRAGPLGARRERTRGRPRWIPTLHRWPDLGARHTRGVRRSDRFDAVVASRSLHHVPDLALAVDKIAQLAPLLIVEEFAWDQLDERTAAWYCCSAQRPVEVRSSNASATGVMNTPACTAPRLCGQRSIGASVNASCTSSAPTSTGMRG